MAIGLLNSKTILRCISISLLMVYFWLLANSRLVSSNSLESWHYFVTYTKARSKRNDLLSVYDLAARVTCLISLSLAIPYVIFFGGAVAVFSRGFNWTRIVRPYLHNHRNWTYQPDVEANEFAHYNKMWCHIDDWYMMISLVAAILVGLHYLFGKSVVSQLFTSTTTRIRVEVDSK